MSTEDGSKEFKVPMPWGYVAGKEWGPPDGIKALAVHGWQDNAGSFDRLIPMLDPSLHVYAIDLPGHGRSSPFPDGISDVIGDKISAIHRVVLHFDMKGFIYIGHSLGSAIGYLYSATFPDFVSKYVAIDLLKPYVQPLERALERTRLAVEGLIKIDSKRSCQPPSYSYDEAIKKLVEGMAHSVTEDSAKILAKRGLTESPSGGFYFSRDLKLKFPAINYGVTSDNMVFYSHKITCPVLFISCTSFRGLAYSKDEMEVLKKREAAFIYETVEGTHHAHLNDPEKVSHIINKFISS